MSEYSNEFSVSEYAEKTGQPKAAVNRALKELPEDASFSAIAAALTNAALNNVVATTAGNRLSVSELARLTGLDRNTVSKRLEGLEPIPGPKNAALYELPAALPRLLSSDADTEDYKARKIAAEAELQEMKRDELLGKIARVDEFTEVLIRIFSSMYQRVAVRYPVEASAKLAKAKTSTAVATILRKDFAGLFARLRTDFREFLEPEQSN